MTGKGHGSYAFIFVCQGGPFELKALYLAASLRRNLACDHELIAALPQDYELPAPATLDLLAQLGVRTVPIRNQLDLAYPIGNKLSCLAIATSAGKKVFLDSDMLLVRRFEHEPRFEIAFNAKPCDAQSFTGGEGDWSRPYQRRPVADAVADCIAMWRPIYELAGVSIDAAQWIPATVTGEYGPPYFNAGFIAVDASAGLAEPWLEYCKLIDADPRVTNKRPWLDQLALPLAVARLGLEVDCLDDRYNYPALLRPIGPELPYFCHYHWPRVIRQDHRLVELIESLDREHPDLAQARAQTLAWSQIGKRSAIPRRLGVHVPEPDLLITGIPHSGAEELASLLNQTDDCVVFEEPPHITSALAQARPIRVYGYHRGRRSQLEDRAAGIPKTELRWLDDEELRGCDRRVSRVDFVLGTRNEIGYLSRLAAVRRVIPDARAAICVRSPFDTIAAWKLRDPVLAAGEVARWPVGSVTDELLSGEQRRALELISLLPTSAMRRAALWSYFADLVIEQLTPGASVVLVRYHRLVREPRAAIGEVVAGWSIDVPDVGLAPSEHHSILDAEDIRAIRAACAGPASELGVFDGAPVEV